MDKYYYFEIIPAPHVYKYIINPVFKMDSNGIETALERFDFTDKYINAWLKLTPRQAALIETEIKNSDVVAYYIEKAEKMPRWGGGLTINVGDTPEGLPDTYFNTPY